MMAVDLKEQIRTYIVEHMLYGDDTASLENGTSLINEGIVDSTGVVELVLYVEDAFGVTVASDEIIPDNFDSIEQLANYVVRKQGAN